MKRRRKNSGSAWERRRTGGGEELRDFPLFMQRVKFFPDVPDSEAVTDIYLPLR